MIGIVDTFEKDVLKRILFFGIGPIVAYRFNQEKTVP